VIHELRISDVIFSTQKLSYTDILSVISRATDRSVNYHLVPTSLEVMIGKASIDTLNELPLVQISYNIQRPLNRGLKRAMDLALSLVLLISVLGLLKAFEANGGPGGTNFVVRATCLSFPIGVKVNVLSIGLGWLNYFLFPIIVDPATFRDPDRVFDLVTFIWAPAFTALFFWRLLVHFVEISKKSAPNKAPQPTPKSGAAEL